MLLSKTAFVKWNSKNKKHYVDIGYTFTNFGDSFEVSVDDLTCGSTAIITIKCDYCGKEYTSEWQTYRRIKDKSYIQKDCCGDCCQNKAKETIKEKYGDSSNMFFSCNEKRVKTNIERYGSANVFGSDKIKEKITETNIERYGVPYAQQNDSVRIKTINTCKEKYGVDNYIELFRGKFIGENSPCWKGGIEYSNVDRATHEYALWRNAVFSRDAYTCQKCGAHNGNGREIILNAHHIMNWHDYYNFRYDVNNGITLCQACHNRFHSQYGKRHNTRSQIESFLLSDEKIC